MNDYTNNNFQESNKKTTEAANKVASSAFSAGTTIKNVIQNKDLIKNDFKKIANKIKSIFSNKNYKGLFAKVGVAIGCIPLLAVTLIITICNLFSPSTWFSKQTDLETIQSNTDAIIKEAYDANKKEVQSYVIAYVDTHYNCGANIYDVNEGTIDNETSKNICKINIEYSPKYDESINKINAYASAVDGVLEYFKEEEYDEEHDEENSNNIYEYSMMSKEEREAYIENTKADIDSSGSESTSQMNDAYLNSLKNSKDKIFHPELTSAKWQTNVNVTKNVIVGYEQKTVCDEYTVRECSDGNTYSVANCGHSMFVNDSRYRIAEATEPGAICTKSHQEDDLTRPIKKDIAEGNITIPMNYNATFYKQDELDALVPVVAEKYQIGNIDALDMINETISIYYQNYFDAYGLSENGDGTYAGINPIFFEKGQQGWDGDFEESDYVGSYNKYRNLAERGSFELIWNHIKNMLGTESRQCSTLTSAWAIDAYGDEIYGDGQNMVAKFVSNKGYTLLDTPAPGAIFSTSAYGKPGCKWDDNDRSCNPYGHTGIVLSVHSDINKVTILEANYDRNGSLRIKDLDYDKFINCEYTQGKYIKFAIKK